MYNSFLEWSSDTLEITDVLNLIRIKIESINSLEDKFLRSKGNDNGFEDLFPIIAKEVASELLPQNTLDIYSHLGHHFPDIDLILNGVKYGVELKSRSNGSWSTNGNSVFESVTSEGYKDIFIVFGSKVPKEKRLLVKFSPYWQATSNIKVTHSPRFTIDMNSNESVFKNKEEYDSLRVMGDEGKVDFLQTYLRENSVGYGAKWYISPNESIPPTKFIDLSTDQKNQLRVEILILFPDDLFLGSHKTKYDRSAEYLLESYFVYNKNLRDIFTSGGVYNYNDILFPKMFKTLSSLKELVIDILDNASPDFFELAKESWSKNLPTSLITDSLYDSYENVINYIGTSELYKELLEQANIKKLSDFIL